MNFLYSSTLDEMKPDEELPRILVKKTIKTKTIFSFR
jgi:hypothetical protein